MNFEGLGSPSWADKSIANPKKNGSRTGFEKKSLKRHVLDDFGILFGSMLGQNIDQNWNEKISQKQSEQELFLEPSWTAFCGHPTPRGPPRGWILGVSPGGPRAVPAQSPGAMPWNLDFY